MQNFVREIFKWPLAKEQLLFRQKPITEWIILPPSLLGTGLCIFLFLRLGLPEKLAYKLIFCIFFLVMLFMTLFSVNRIISLSKEKLPLFAIDQDNLYFKLRNHRYYAYLGLDHRYLVIPWCVIGKIIPVLQRTLNSSEHILIVQLDDSCFESIRQVLDAERNLLISNNLTPMWVHLEDYSTIFKKIPCSISLSVTQIEPVTSSRAIKKIRAVNKEIFSLPEEYSPTFTQIREYKTHWNLPTL